MTFKEIVKFLSKDPTTISKEIKKHRTRKEPSYHMGYINICKKNYTCKRKNVCGRNCPGLCSKYCSKCNKFCKEFEEEICNSLIRAPFVCNSCPSKAPCRLVKYYYRALPAHNQYENTLSVSRQGINLSAEELCELDNIVSPLIKNRQTISHIFKTQDLKCSKSTLYNYIDQNVLSARNIDLPRRVKYLKQHKSKRKPPKDTSIGKCRTYEDFEKYLLENPDIQVVEMDTVEGKKGGKVLLTFLTNISTILTKQAIIKINIKVLK